MSDAKGTDITRFNALRHGILSRHTLLPWEDGDAYDGVLAALAAEHAPVGPTEEHLVEEIAGILWRKRRLRMAEAAAFGSGLADVARKRGIVAEAATAHLRHTSTGTEMAEAIDATPETTAAELAGIDEDEAMSRAALSLAGAGDYEGALAALREDTRGWWLEESQPLDDAGEPAEIRVPERTAKGLAGFIEGSVLPVFSGHRSEIARRPLLRAHAAGRSFDPDRLDRLARYEAHLDRKLERTLSMLVKLREMRLARKPG